MQSGKRVEPTVRPRCLGTSWPSITGINKRWPANRGNKSRVQIANFGVTLSAVWSVVNVTSRREANRTIKFKAKPKDWNDERAERQINIIKNNNPTYIVYVLDSK